MRVPQSPLEADESLVSYRHDAVVDDATHLHVLQVTVLDVLGQVAGGAAVGTRGLDQPLNCERLGQQLGLHLDKHTTVLLELLGNI